MKIAHIVCSFPPYFGGMGNVAYQLTQALRDRGHDVMVLTPRFGEADEDEIAYVKRLSPSISFGNAARLPQIKKELDEYDIVHLHYPFFGTANLVRHWKKKNPNKKLVITYHMDNRAPDWKGLLFKLYAQFWMPKIVGVADACIGSSLDYIIASDAAGMLQKEKDKWHAIPFGVDPERFMPRPAPLELFDAYQLDPELPTLVFVGGMDPAHHFKGIPKLLQAIRILHNSDLPVQCVLVGDGSLREQFEQQARALSVDHAVRFVGRISDDDLPYHYNMADLVVLPSTAKNEAFGMVLLEAYASGVPVVASNLPGVRTVAEYAGMTVPPNDPEALAEAIFSYYQSSVDQQALRTAARKAAVEVFSWPHIAEEVEALYTKLIHGKS